MEPTPSSGLFQRLGQDASRFIVVGCISYTVDFLVVFQLLTHGAGLHPLAAQPISRLCGGLVSFTLNKFWTFRRKNQESRLGTQFLRYWMAWIGALIVSEGLLALFFNVLLLDKQTSKVLADGITGLLSFFIQRHWTFR